MPRPALRARVLLPVILAAGCASAAPPAGTIQFPADAVRWTPGPPSLPPGTQVAVLEGDPKSEGLFTMRLKVPAGTRIPPHWHPREERVTVLEGLVRVGFGERSDVAAGRGFGPGGFYVNPPLAHHQVWFPEPSVVQITGMGPWQVHYLQPRGE